MKAYGPMGSLMEKVFYYLRKIKEFLGYGDKEKFKKLIISKNMKK